MVEIAGLSAGLSLDHLNDLVCAVHEVAINAVLYAGGSGVVTVAQSPSGVWVEVRDTGPGLPADVSVGLKSPSATRGRGLWLARRMCRRMRIVSSDRGVTVNLFAPVGFAFR